VVRLRLVRNERHRDFWEQVLTYDRGHYDDYGRIEEGPRYEWREPSEHRYIRDFTDPDLSVFVHAGTWDRILQEFPLDPEYLPSSYRVEDLERQVEEQLDTAELACLQRLQDRWEARHPLRTWEEFKLPYLNRLSTGRAKEGAQLREYCEREGKDFTQYNFRGQYDPVDPEGFRAEWHYVVSQLPPRQPRRLTSTEVRDLTTFWVFCNRTRIDWDCGQEFRGHQSYDERPYYDVLLEEIRLRVDQFYQRGT
jgi:hypothetical protein